MRQQIFALATVLLSGVSFLSHAQNSSYHKFSISLGSGIANTDLNNSEFQFHHNVGQCYRPCANLNVSAKYQLTKKVSIGLTAGFYHFSRFAEETHVVTPNLATTDPGFRIGYSSEDYQRHTTYLAIEGIYTYKQLHKYNISLYATAGLGVNHTTGYVDSKSSDTYVNWPPYGTCYVGFWGPQLIDENKLNAYISPVGVTGGKRFFWYGELGYGYKGIVNAGIGYKL